MALHIKDAETEEAVRDLARVRRSTLTDAIKTACRAELKRERSKLPVDELLTDLHAEIRALPRTGEKADKAFFDELSGDSD